MKGIIKHRPPPAVRPARHDLSLGDCHFSRPEGSYTAKEKLIFVIMPFKAHWSDRLWNDHIRKYLTVADDSIEVRRADDMFGQGVMEDVWECIVTSRLVIADCTDRNPNVLYELGLAHAIGKRTVLLSQREGDIPFDLKRFRFCIYEDNSSGYPTLQRFLETTVRDVVLTR
jgi:hypothetical protein